MNKKTIQIWFAVNKNGFVGLYAEEPKRNSKIGKWESLYPFINSIIYKEISELVEKTKINWEHEPECITLSF